MLILQSIQEKAMFESALAQYYKERCRVKVQDDPCIFCGNKEFYYYRETAGYKCTNCKTILHKSQISGRFYKQ